MIVTTAASMSVLTILSLFVLELTKGNDCKDGNCDLYSSSGYRLQFLGGYKDTSSSDEMCYKYKLHEYKHKKGLKMVEIDDRITVSMQICANDENNIVSDYLKKVRIFNNNNNGKDSYYVDDTHFYYISHNNGNNSSNDDAVIELCFEDDNNGKLVTETEYCIQHNNENKLCSKRGIFMTNICNSKNEHTPPSNIDYIPTPGGLYNVGSSSHMNGLTRGKGSFELHPMLVVLRGWWIDSCIMINNEKEVIVEINDDYFDEINLHNKYINEFDDLIDSPLTLPIYDHFIIEYPECSNIHGIIRNYKHNITNEKLTLYIDIENSSPLMFFNEAKFQIQEMSLFKLESDNANDNRRRRRLSSVGFSKTVNLPIDTIDNKKVDIYYYNRKTKKEYDFGDCWITMAPYASATIGFSLDYTLKFDWFSTKARLNSIAAKLGFSIGINSEITCTFGEDNDDGKVDVELFSKQITFGKYSATVGPIVLTVKPFVDIGAVLTRPAMAITVGAYGDIDATLSSTGGWNRNDGAFGFVDKSLSIDFDYHKPVFPGSNGRIGAEFAITVSPGLSFGIYNNDILYISIPLELPYIHSEISLDKNRVCGANEFALNFDIDIGLSITTEIGIHDIKIWGIKIFGGMSWSPNEPLYTLSLWSVSESVDLNDPCKNVDQIDSSTLFSNEYTLHYYNDYPYVFVNTEGTDWQDRLSYSQANAYCSMKFGSTLATIKTQEKYDQVKELMEDYSSVDYFPYIGLYDDDNDGTFNWIKDDEEYNGPINVFNNWCPDTECVCGTFETALSSDNFFIKICFEESQFICDLYTITEEYDRYIGVYTYDIYYTWDEANNYCNDTYGTELATIITQKNNDNAYQTILNINNNKLSTPKIWRAWIGINNILESNNFEFQDGRNSNTTEYTNWASDNPDGIGSINEQCGQFWYQSTSDKKWRDLACDHTVRSFICNRPNFYDIYEYENFIGVEAENYGVTYDEANRFCQDEFGTTLASIHSQSEQDEINDITSHFEWDINYNTNKNAWIGFRDIDNEGNFVWNDGTITSYTNWKSGQPNDWGDTGQDCTVILPYENNKWNDMSCDNTYESFICNRHKSVYEYNNYIGINTHSDNSKYNWNDANNYCIDNYKTTLASIHSSNDMDDIKHIYDIIDGEDTWIGFNDINKEGTFVWSDGSNVDYTYWDAGEPNNYNSNQDCGRVRGVNTNQEWDDAECDDEYTSFICNREISEIETRDFIGINLRNTAGNGYTWSDANNYCINNYNTHLASILNENQYDQSVNIWKIFDNPQMWIGLHDTINEGTFEWIDGNSVSYTKWKAGEPSNTWSGVDCVEIRGDANGMWNDISCNQKISAFLCNKPISSYQDGFYVAIYGHNENKFTFDEANNYCLNNFDTTLATFLDDNNNDNYDLVESMFGMIEGLNDYGRAWIGAHDTNTENTFEWIDGSGILSNTDSHWHPNRPNGWLNQNCVEMWVNVDWNGPSLVDGFNDLSCDIKLNSFICNNKYEIFRNGNFIGVNVHTQANNNFNTKISYSDAQLYCNRHFGTYLASIHSEDEKNEISTIWEQISDQLGYSGWIWIGLNDPSQNNNNYQWTDGTQFDYTNWYSNEPNHVNYQCVVVVNQDGQWRDSKCDVERAAFFCNA